MWAWREIRSQEYYGSIAHTDINSKSREMKKILLHFMLIIGFLLLCMFGLHFWLRAYTNHGQSLELSNYIGLDVAEARTDASDRNFEIVVLDSTFIVGKAGGEILRQNPLPGAKVKENRKIYVTVTKSLADQIPLRRLPVLYGKGFERKSRELKQAYEIESRIIDERYDRGAPNHILEVRYNGEIIIDGRSRKDQVMIDKGATLEFVVSKNSGGTLAMPDLTCKTYDEVVFQLQTLNLAIGDVALDDDVENRNGAFVWKQYPASSGLVNMGDTIALFLSAQLPEFCEF